MNHDIQLMSYQEEWTRRFSEDSDPNGRIEIDAHLHCPYNIDCRCWLCLPMQFATVVCMRLLFSSTKTNVLSSLVAYSRLVVFSFGFQQAYQRGIQPGDNLYFDKGTSSSLPLPRHSFSRYVVGCSSLSSGVFKFIIKLLKPEFSSLLAKEQETEIFDLIGRLIQTLSSPEIAIDDRHTPKLYARFLAGLLSRHRRDGATVGRLHPHPPANNNSPSHDFAHSGTLPSTSTFSITSSQTSESPTQGSSFGSSSFQQNGKMDTTPIYQPEATFSSATGAIHFGSDVGVSGLGGSMSDEDMLATMQALKNPAWWENMMMPG
ncbi:hypothetical protein C0989_004203 [Termitomyces sp. Mn162]|nr:hypothetical protein C0989_004203 [Termitomyces sp. Mn162]